MNRHQFQFAARQFRAGKIHLNDFTDQVFGKSLPDRGTDQPSIDSLPALPDRAADSHKGDYGRILVIAGSRGMAGAAALTGLAALRGGAGLVTIATARSCQAVVAGFHPAIMTVGLRDDQDGRIAVESWAELAESVPEFDCLAIGPGLGISAKLQGLMRDVFRNAPRLAVIDADGLNNLGIDFDWPTPVFDRVLTPHPGELRRLVRTADNDRATLERDARQLALRLPGAIVLKGHHSLVTDGHRSRHNPTGNPGMATAGSGDVLTGIIAALAGQGLDAWGAAVLGCLVHGAAGDRAAGEKGQPGTIATDIIDSLPAVLTQAAVFPLGPDPTIEHV